VELGAKSVVLSQAGDVQRQAALEARVEKVLSSTGFQYMKLVSFGMVGLAMLVYVRAEIHPFISDVDCDRVKTGLQGGGGNKGAVVTRFCIGQFSLCFTNVHLASGQNATTERNQHLSDILSDAFQGTSMRGSTRPPKQGFLRQSKYRIPIHHFSVIMGDFNARLNVAEKEKRPDGEWQDWLKLDQLLLGLIASLKGYREGPLTFPPTFKYIPGTDILTDKRIPAWCDRVVFKADYDAHAELFEYTSHPLKYTSDHRPVSALFAVAAVDGAWTQSQPTQETTANAAAPWPAQPVAATTSASGEASSPWSAWPASSPAPATTQEAAPVVNSTADSAAIALPWTSSVPVTNDDLISLPDGPLRYEQVEKSDGGSSDSDISREPDDEVAAAETASLSQPVWPSPQAEMSPSLDVSSAGVTAASSSWPEATAAGAMTATAATETSAPSPWAEVPDVKPKAEGSVQDIWPAADAVRTTSFGSGGLNGTGSSSMPLADPWAAVPPAPSSAGMPPADVAWPAATAGTSVAAAETEATQEQRTPSQESPTPWG